MVHSSIMNILASLSHSNSKHKFILKKIFDFLFEIIYNRTYVWGDFYFLLDNFAKLVHDIEKYTFFSRG